jgi:tRNA A-37 threonylcarbamoyl transferase component Bud32
VKQNASGLDSRRIGRVIPPERIGRYRLTGEIGHGAMGAVYRAHDPQLERDVAVKLISLAYAAGHGDPKEAAARFAREARVAARVQHPNVVAIYDAGEEGDQLFLVMELVAGETLAQRLVRGEFPGTTAALDIVAQTADALAAAHLAGVIHRDIKPGNLLLPKSGHVKVSDFGIAKAVGEATELTRTGMMVGSPAYMAPEQVQGVELDGRSDLFSLGVVLYEMLMHRKPFPADTLTTLVYQILHQDPFESETVAGRLHPDLIDLLRWSLAKERDVRIPDAQTFATRARALKAQFARSGATGATGATAPTAPMRGVAAPMPLPPASYSTSAPTEIVRRPRESWQRWAVWAGLGLLLAALAVGLALRQPAPPPDLAQPVDARAANDATVSAELVTPGTSPASPGPPAADPATPADTPLSAAGQRVEQQSPPARARPEPPGAAESPAAATAAPAPEAAPLAIAPPAVEPPPPIAAVFECRKGAEFHVEPEEALVTIDGQLLGPADDWDGAGGGETYSFPGPGDYLVKLSLQGFRTAWVKVVVTPSAKRDVVDVDTELEEID